MDKSGSKNIGRVLGELANLAIDIDGPVATRAQNYGFHRTMAKAFGSTEYKKNPARALEFGRAQKEMAKNVLKEASAMDKELATAVFKRWAGGQPVAETTFHKAASVLGLNPDDALLEARFYTCLDYDLKKVASGKKLDEASVRLYSLAAGINPRDMMKTAASYALSAQDLAFQSLAANNWVPNLHLLKVAMMAPMMDDGSGGGGGGAPMMDPAAMGGDAAAPEGAEGEPPPPDPNAQVQQDPMRRFKPSPMAPVQTPPSQEGNLQELAMAARHPEQGQMAGMGGMGADPMGGMESAAGPQDPAPPMSPDQKLLAVQQNIPPEALNRWAGKFSELEKQVGMSIDDPAQIGKFIAQMQKDDAKMVDEAIKNMAVQTAPVRPTIQQQAAQQQQQGGGGQQPPAGGGSPPQQAAPGGAPPPQQQQKPKPQPSKQAPQQPQQKVATRRVWLP